MRALFRTLALLVGLCVPLDVRAEDPTWGLLQTAGPLPTARSSMSGVYDAAHDKLIVFGGVNFSGTLGDLWMLSNASGVGGTPSWTQLSPAGTPPSGRVSHTAVYDAGANRMIVFGGDVGG